MGPTQREGENSPALPRTHAGCVLGARSAAVEGRAGQPGSAGGRVLRGPSTRGSRRSGTTELGGGGGRTAAACGGARWRRCSGRGGAGGPRDGAARRRVTLGELGARGSGKQARAGAVRGVHRRRSRASAAARRRSGSGGAGFERGKGREGRVGHEEAHRALDLGGGWPEIGD